MMNIIVQHDVKDFATWKEAFVGDKSNRTAAGVKGHTVGQLAGAPNTAVMVFQIEDTDMPKLQQMMQSPEMQAVMANAGVISAPIVTVMQGAESETY